MKLPRIFSRKPVRKNKRFIKKIKTYISFSGGVESTTMCVLYGKGATAIWCDTGAENKEMYARIDKVERRLKKLHAGKFKLKRIRASVKVKGVFVDNLIDAIIGWRYMPSSGNRWCTGKFKIEPIDNFLSKQGKCELLIGFNADEETRVGNYMKCKNVSYRYPLQEDDLTRNDCEDILKGLGLHPEFPIYMQRGGCFMCIFKKETEIKAYYFFDRPTFDKMRWVEETVQDIRKNFFALLSNKKSMKSIADNCERELALWGIEGVRAMYSKIQPGQACGAFCQR